MDKQLHTLDTYINYNTEHETKLYIPNEIFTDLKQSGIKGSSHIAFAYSYYWLISWLYRYTKYGEVKVTVQLIKEILGYKNDKRIDYIIKKGGILDELGYTMSDNDYPIGWEFNDGDIVFDYMSEMNPESREVMKKFRGANYKIKIPVKGLWGSEDRLGGTFYDISNTHEMDVDMFDKCMDGNCGLVGFYLYGYLKDKCQKHGEYKSSIDRIADGCGLSYSTVKRYLGMMVECGLIECSENSCKIIDGEFQKEPNTYKVR